MSAVPFPDAAWHGGGLEGPLPSTACSLIVSLPIS